MMTKSRYMKGVLALSILLLGIAPAAAQPAGEELPAAAPTPEAEAQPANDDELGIYDRYVEYMRSELNRIGSMEIWGVTGQLPKGYLSAKWDRGWINAKHRYDDKRALGPVMKPIEFNQNGQKLLSVDMGLEGYGGGHTFQFSYGITNPLDWYIEIPFTYLNIGFNPKLNDIDPENKNGLQGYKIHPTAAGLLGVKDPKNYTACQFLHETLPYLGRPPVATRYHGEWLLGDINTGFSWNVHRTKRYSLALTPRVYLPTGYTPAPEDSLTYATGPGVETGIGGWAVSATEGFDIRLLNIPSIFFDSVFSTELTAGYAFEQKRPYPKNFVKPNGMAMMLDPISFPDLSHLQKGGEFRYTPGWSMSWTAQLNLSLAIFSLGLGYGVDWKGEAELVGDPAFIQMAKGLQLLGSQSVEAVQLAGSINLLGLCAVLPVCIPAQLSLQYTKVIDGYNALVYDDFWQLTIKGYIPINPGDDTGPVSTGGL